MASETPAEPREQADRSGLYGLLVKFLFASVLVVAAMVATRVALPVPLPHIQLPAEAWTIQVIPGFDNIPMTNTMLAVLVSDLVILLIAFRVRAKVLPGKEGDPVERVPGGLQNFVESILEFWEDQSIQIIGERLTRRWLPLVVTIFALVWIVNWSELVPGYDSIGVAFPPLHGSAVVTQADLVQEARGAGEEAEAGVGGEGGSDADEDAGHAGEAGEAGDAGHAGEAGEAGDAAHAGEAGEAGDAGHAEAAAGGGGLGWLLGVPDDGAEHTYFKVDATIGPLKFLSCRSDETEGCAEPGDERSGFVPFFRVASSDLNFTLALALISFVSIQIAGFRELGLGYMTKFFNFKEGLLGIFVGLLELVSEISRIISFAFRLFGNMFAGQVLIFVMMFLVPIFAVVPVYGLELFVGLIQAYVFAVLTLAFIGQAIIAHGHDH